jgi:hypothetical protein
LDYYERLYETAFKNSYFDLIQCFCGEEEPLLFIAKFSEESSKAHSQAIEAVENSIKQV